MYNKYLDFLEFRRLKQIKLNCSQYLVKDTAMESSFITMDS